MKIWTMPKVEIEGFSANEYVAASCGSSDPVNIESGYYYYLDYDGNDYFKGANYEDASYPDYPYHGVTNYLDKATLQGASGWLNDIKLYRSKAGYNGTNVPYKTSDYVETYDLYILGQKVYLYRKDVYNGGTAPFDPTDKKPFS